MIPTLVALIRRVFYFNQVSIVLKFKSQRIINLPQSDNNI